MDVDATFLSGPTVALSLPSDYDARPDATAIVTIDNGSKCLTFRPWTRANDPGDRTVLKRLNDRVSRGRSVEIYETVSEPAIVMAFWRLQSGLLETFMHDGSGCRPDLLEGLRAIIDNTVVNSGSDESPIVSLQPPLRRGNPARTLERDDVTFFSDSGRSIIKLRQEPAWQAEVRQRWQSDDSVSIREPSALEVSVECAGPAAEEAVLAETARSVALSLKLVS